MRGGTVVKVRGESHRRNGCRPIQAVPRGRRRPRHSSIGAVMNDDRSQDENRRARWLFREELNRFSTEVLGVDWALLTVHSRLSDFDSLLPRDELARRIEGTFGIPANNVFADPSCTVVGLLRRLPRPSRDIQTVIREELGFRELLPAEPGAADRMVRVMAGVVSTSQTVADLEHRLRSAFESSTTRAARPTFARWGWLAEDVFARTRSQS